MKRDNKKPIPFPVFIIFAVLLLGGSILLKKLNTPADTVIEDNVTVENETATDPEAPPKEPDLPNPFLSESNGADQAIVVTSLGTDATVEMYEKNADSSWSQILKTTGYVGEDGVGEASEDRCATPEGVYHITQAFGILSDPGCAMDYIRVDDSYYWVDDTDSKYYNLFVSTDTIEPDWDSAEHITAVGYPYNYVLAFDYNADCIPGKGSAFFLHCTQNKPTQGCITVSEEDMKTILCSIHDGCVIIIH